MKTIRICILTLELLLATNVTAQDYLVNRWYCNNEGVGLCFGYTSQQFQAKYNDYNDYFDGIWGDKNRLHGAFLGFAKQGNWGYGIGLYWGANLEFYLSTNNPTAVYQANSVNEAFDTYIEFTLNAPLHLAFKLPLRDNFALGFHTGPGVTLSYIAFFSDMRGYFDDWFCLGDGIKVFNLTYDFALFTEIGSIRFDVQWSTGLINQQSSSDWDKLTRNKFSIGLTRFWN